MSLSFRSTGAPPRPWAWWIAIGAATLYAVVFLVVAPGASYDVAGSLAVTPLIVVGGWVLVARLAARDPDPAVGRILRLGYALKLVAAAAYYLLVFAFSGGDAAYYHDRGRALADAVWSGRPAEALAAVDVGTAAMEGLAGLLYTLIGPTSTGAFAVFSLVAFVGTYLFLRAFTFAVPHGDRRLFAALAFLLPSMLFWSAALGKDAWMLLGLGLLAYGAARLLSGRRGVVALLAGVGAAGVIRPHMAALGVLALAAAPLAQRRPSLSRRARRARLVLLVTLVLAGSVAVVVAMRMFSVTSLAPGEISLFFDALGEQTAIGGSEFTNLQTINPLLAPLALASVLFRPLPFEANSGLMLLASLEGLVLAGVLWYHRRAIGAALRATWQDGYAAFVVTYVLLFGLAYSYFNNLGLLVRERIQVLPFVFALVAYRAGDRRERRV